MPGPYQNAPTISQDADSGPRTLIQDVYQRLRADIINGDLKPGTRLRAEHLKSTYNASAATMREALALLVADSLVVAREQRGFIVAPVSLADFADITETRALLESHAVRMSVHYGDDDWEVGLTGAFHRLSLAEERRGSVSDDSYWEECNQRFHEALVAGYHSSWTRHFLSILYRQSERYRHIARLNSPPERDVHAEHVAIFEAAIARQEDLVADLIAQHVRDTLTVVSAVESALISSDAA